MSDSRTDRVLTLEEQKEVEELVSLFVVLPKEDRAVLLSNAVAFKVRKGVENGEIKEQQ